MRITVPALPQTGTTPDAALLACPTHNAEDVVTRKSSTLLAITGLTVPCNTRASLLALPPQSSTAGAHTTRAHMWTKQHVSQHNGAVPHTAMHSSYRRGRVCPTKPGHQAKQKTDRMRPPTATTANIIAAVTAHTNHRHAAANLLWLWSHIAITAAAPSWTCVMAGWASYRQATAQRSATRVQSIAAGSQQIGDRSTIKAKDHMPPGGRSTPLLERECNHRAVVHHKGVRRPMRPSCK